MTVKTAVPESRLGGSETPATTRSNSEAGARLRQPTQVRTGVARLTTNGVYPADGANSATGVDLELVSRPGPARPRPAPPPPQPRRPPRCRAGCRSANRSTGPRG